MKRPGKRQKIYWKILEIYWKFFLELLDILKGEPLGFAAEGSYSNVCSNLDVSRAGCLQLLEILEIYLNLKTLLEILEISLNLMVLLEIFV